MSFFVAEPLIPPPKDAIVQGVTDVALIKRDCAICEIEGLGGDSEARQLYCKIKMAIYIPF
ncbi:hypothetical protein PHSC3_001337 [Chlamydiales bacterium STE3]|nr:hypothetical protein PHSC3_001337 [Chlamydiales bacterium STE3]